MITTKTKEDIRILREGGKRHAEILRAVVTKVRPGISTKELDEYAAKLITEKGDFSSFLNYKPEGAPYPYPASICTSINDEVVHGLPSEDRILKEGDIISIDLGLVHGGLFTDAAVTVPVGIVDPELAQLMEVTKSAMMAGIKAAKGGKTVGDIGAAIERYALPYGYSIIDELVGHGVGYRVHEDPYVPNYGDPKTGPKLVPGMVLAIEPMLNLGVGKVVLDADGYTYRTQDGEPSAHFEHTILITKGDAEILTI